MSSARRRSGIVVETSGSASLDAGREGAGPAAARDLLFFAPPRTGGPRRRGRARIGRPASGAEAEAIRGALAAAQMERVDAIPLRTGVAPGARRRRRGGRRGRAGRRGPAEAALESSARAVSTVSLSVPLAKTERAVVLLEQDGVYSWHVPTQVAPAARGLRGRAPGRRRGRAGKAGRGATAGVGAGAGAKVARFELELPAGRPVPSRRPGRARRRGLASMLIGRAMAHVFRFVAKPILKGAVKFLERNVKEGPVHLTGTDPAAWTLLSPTDVLPPGSRGGNGAPGAQRAPRVLLLVHGTFSSTIGSFGALAGTEEGQAFLEAALEHYDHVVGWNHKTLSASPLANARDLLAWWRAQKWKRAPVVDAVAFSRGGLVLRSLVEDLLPGSSAKAEVRRVVFVGCTNGGTELARPANWHRLADLHMNLAAAGVRALGGVTGFAAVGLILSEGIQGVAALVKLLATSAVDDEAVPGLSAMNPAGKFVAAINARQPGQPGPKDLYYCAVTSDFDPDEADDSESATELPPGFLLKLADKGADALHGKPNDLVVHVDAMIRLDAELGTFLRERLDYGTNGTVHHCRYFAEPATADALARWLQVG